MHEASAGNVSRAADDHAGYVIVLRSGAHEVIEVAHDIRESHGRAFRVGVLGDCEEASVAERGAVLVTRFGDAIGIDDEQILRLEVCVTCRIFFAEFDA